MYRDDTVFALSTPVGGAITVMRISGSNSRALLSEIFTGKIGHRHVSVGRIVGRDGGVVDTAEAVFYEAPNSYTGEDMAELFCHGSYAVAALVSETIAATGLARHAEPGEFTKRAYLNGKLDLAQAEAVMDLISSTAERSRAAAVMQLEGRLSALVSSLYERVKLACAELANSMDDDTGEAELDPSGFSFRLGKLREEIGILAESGMRSRILREGARIALIGSPNVGKSSLLNALIMRERAIVTPIPGTTRDTVEESISIEGIPFVLVDTAGIRDSADEIECCGIERSRAEAARADLVLWVVDGTRPLNEDDRAVLEGIGGTIAAVITKADAEQVIFPDADGTFCGYPAVATSAVTGFGLDALKKLAASLAVPESDSMTSDPVITNSRHISLLLSAGEKLGLAAEAIQTGDTDASFLETRSAMDDIAGIIGIKDVSEELVDSIFAKFCLGK